MNRFDNKSRTRYLDQFYGTKAYYIPNSHRQWQKKYEPTEKPTYYYDYFSNQPTPQQSRRGSVYTESNTPNRNMLQRRKNSIYQ
ncbi:hypothetical protein pb186bvf_005599 [Paramecium bursaria]